MRSQPVPVFPDSLWGVLQEDTEGGDATRYVKKRSLQSNVVSVLLMKQDSDYTISKTFTLHVVLENESHFSTLEQFFTEKKQSHLIRDHHRLPSSGHYSVKFLTSPNISVHATILNNLAEFNPACVDIKTHFLSTFSLDIIALPQWIPADTTAEADPELLADVHLRGMPIQAWIPSSVENGIKFISVHFDLDKFDFVVLSTESPELVQSNSPFTQIRNAYCYTFSLNGYTGDLFISEKARCFAMLARMNADSNSFQAIVESFFEKIRRDITENADPESNLGASFFNSHKISRNVGISTFLRHAPQTFSPETMASLENLKISCNPGVLSNHYAKRLAAAHVSDDQIPTDMICTLSGLIMDAPCIDLTSLTDGNSNSVARIDYAFFIYSLISRSTFPQLTEAEENEVFGAASTVEERAERLLPHFKFFSPLTRQPINIDTSIAIHDTLLESQIEEFVVRKEIEAEWEKTKPMF